MGAAQILEMLHGLATRGKPVLLLIDGLDLADPATAATLFGPGTFLCDDRLPAVVYTAPHAMLTQSAAESRDVRFGQAWHLPAFPVVNVDGTWNEEVGRHLADGLGRRLRGVDILDDPEPLLLRVALHSGGIPRHAVTILRGAVLATGGERRVSVHHIVMGERELRQDLEQSLTPPDARALATAIPSA